MNLIIYLEMETNMSYNSWIDFDCKKYYLDSKKHGLRLLFDKKYPFEGRNLIKKYIVFLRKKYFFPIRCKIYIHNCSFFLNDSGKRIYGKFVNGQKTENLIVYPCIFVAAKSAIENMDNVLLNLTKLLTYYYQWYFFDDKNRTSKSVEREANYYAFCLLDIYHDYCRNKSTKNRLDNYS